MGASLEIRQSSDRHRVALLGNALITVRRGPPVYEHMRALFDVQRELLKQEDPLGGLNVLLDLSVSNELMLPEAVRSIVRRSIAMSQSRRGGIAFIAGLTGFAGATTRSFFSVLELTLRPVAPIRLFSRVEEGAGWLAPRIAREGSPGAEELVAHTKQLVAEILPAASAR